MLSNEYKSQLFPCIHQYTRIYSVGGHWHNSANFRSAHHQALWAVEEEKHSERKVCSFESWTSCPSTSAARLSGSRSIYENELHNKCIPEKVVLTPLWIKADIIWAALDQDDHQHLMGAVPTGFGKSLPMLVVALLLPPGESPVDKAAFLKCHTHIKYYGCFAGSTTILIPPLSVIERQLSEDCHKYGIKVLVGSQVRTVQIFLRAFLKLLLNNFQFTATF